ncbi:helix-turn-helix domain-containing protein [Pseudofulvibacter geojedonensis]|uniref:Helix-turn-helix domain-containing protein n=1 Tax=Pseudofulvibacter geojedonensis TaxID=1123758 RepID=A0ABW3I0B7_9FLAO
MPRQRKKPIPPEVIKFGKKVKELRQEREMSQMDVGAAMSIDRENIRKYEKGIQEPKLSTVIKFAKVFEVSFDELLNLED